MRWRAERAQDDSALGERESCFLGSPNARDPGHSRLVVSLLPWDGSFSGGLHRRSFHLRHRRESRRLHHLRRRSARRRCGKLRHLHHRRRSVRRRRDSRHHLHYWVRGRRGSRRHLRYWVRGRRGSHLRRLKAADQIHGSALGCSGWVVYRCDSAREQNRDPDSRSCGLLLAHSDCRGFRDCNHSR
jgi:hypothetical protein